MFKNINGQEDLFLYNTRFGSVALLEDVEPNIKNILISNDENVDNIKDVDVQNFLYENGFLVDGSVNELDMVNNLYNEYVYDEDALSLTLLPTESCNFACPYCFLFDKTTSNMSKQDYDVVLKLIENFCLSNDKAEENKKRIIINWFGGEPTLCVPAILKFMKDVENLKKTYKFSLFSSITTNGYLLSVSNFELLLKSGITSFQVTVYGMKESHDETRYLKNKNGTFDEIFQNLKDIAQLDGEKKYSFSIRGNFNKKTISSMYKFIQLYKDNLGFNPNFNLYFRPIYDYETKNNEVKSMSSDLYGLYEGILMQNNLMQAVKNATNCNNERRLVEPLPSPTFGWCNAEMVNHYIIGKYCKLYLCDTLVGYNPIGSLDKNGFAQYTNSTENILYDVFNDDRTKKCMDCRLLPICYGGCKRNRLENEAQCYWDDKMIEVLMKKSYINRKSCKGGEKDEVYFN